MSSSFRRETLGRSLPLYRRVAAAVTIRGSRTAREVIHGC